MSTTTGTVTWVALIAFILGVAVTAVTVTLTDGRILGIGEREIPAACMDKGRYGPKDKGVSGEPIPGNEANELINNFYRYAYNSSYRVPDGEVFPPRLEGDKFGGAFISKKIIDHVLSQRSNANGIMCYFGWEGEEDGQIQLLVTPAASTEVEFIENPEHTYRIKSYCPDHCIEERHVQATQPSLN